jgi:plasmid maintenance system antidote protein VapI
MNNKVPIYPDTNYNPSHLFDTLLEKIGLKNYAALAKALDVAPPVISKMRHGQLEIGPTMLISMHEESGLSVKELRALMGTKQDIPTLAKPIPARLDIREKLKKHNHRDGVTNATRILMTEALAEIERLDALVLQKTTPNLHTR